MDKPLTLIGRAEKVFFPKWGVTVTARIDTGAKTSTLWASNIHEEGDELRYSLFGKGHAYYTGGILSTRGYAKRLVSNSTGQVQERYTIKTSIVLKGRRIRATFTLADRTTQVYPVLIGRNVLRAKFIVDVKLGEPLVKKEKSREVQKEQQYRIVRQRKDN
jgi:hypothetical protein